MGPSETMDSVRLLMTVRVVALFAVVVSGMVIGLELRRHGVVKGMLAPEWRNYLGPYRMLRIRTRGHLLWLYSYVVGLVVFLVTLAVQCVRLL